MAIPMRLSKRRKHARVWVPGLSRAAGSWHRDEIRNLTGGNIRTVGMGTPYGVFSGEVLGAIASGDNPLYKITFDASQEVNTGPQNVPQHVYQPGVIYLGWPA
jgi:hypothetical protein